MPDYNKLIMMGNLCRDPELRFTPSNNAVCQFTIAINNKWKSKDGQQQEETTFVDCEAWGRTAEVINQYFGKGRPIFIEGRLKQERWEDKDGKKRSKLKVSIMSFQFVGGDNREQSDPATSSSPSDGPHAGIEEDDIPFAPDGIDGPVWRS